MNNGIGVVQLLLIIFNKTENRETPRSCTSSFIPEVGEQNRSISTLEQLGCIPGIRPYWSSLESSSSSSSSLRPACFLYKTRIETEGIRLKTRVCSAKLLFSISRGHLQELISACRCSPAFRSLYRFDPAKRILQEFILAFVKHYLMCCEINVFSLWLKRKCWISMKETH